jgi:hypothetical protein
MSNRSSFIALFLFIAACGGAQQGALIVDSGFVADGSTAPGPIIDASTPFSSLDGSVTTPVTDAGVVDASTSAHDAAVAPTGSTFSGSVKPLLANYGCLDCHMTTPWDSIEALTTSASIVSHLTSTKSKQCPSLPYITPGNAANSYMYQKIVGSGSCFTGDQMPDGEGTVSAADTAALKSWIEAGALDN